MNSETPAIQTRNLHKVFGEKTAIQDLTLTVERGEVFGFLGPNGAGKTTGSEIGSVSCPSISASQTG